MSVAEHPVSYYDYRYSPPVSPKSQPHGCKRKASSRDDELETQNGISSSLKRLRLNNLRRAQIATITSERDLSMIHGNGVTRSAAQEVAGASLHDDTDFMPVDDTSDRVWIHDLNAEIAEIEAEEERARQALLSEAAQEYSKIPENLLTRPVRLADPAAGMQMVLYRDPISISVPVEEDAVRQTILDTRRRMREKQALSRGQVVPLPRDAQITLPPVPDMALDAMNDDDIDMDMDLD